MQVGGCNYLGKRPCCSCSGKSSPKKCLTFAFSRAMLFTACVRSTIMPQLILREGKHHAKVFRVRLSIATRQIEHSFRAR